MYVALSLSCNSFRIWSSRILTWKIHATCSTTLNFVDQKHNWFIIYLPVSKKLCGHRAERGGAIGWGTALQDEMPLFRFPMVSVEFLIDIILTAAVCPGVDSASNKYEYQKYFLGLKAASA